MHTYTASNGMQIAADGHPFALINRNGITTQTLSADDADALREFFRAEEDERLGRWRWPENPDYVVYPRAGEVLVLFEMNGEGGVLYRPGDPVHDFEGQAARAYFDAHPEPKPAWHDAKPGEVWAVDAASLAGSGRQAMIVDSGVFVAPDFAFLVTDSAISGAYRIWPPEESS